jgi:hypothetical protein
MQLRFLVVRHTHDDIDGNYIYIFQRLKKYDNYVLANSMKTFMISQDHPFIPQLIQ